MMRRFHHKIKIGILFLTPLAFIIYLSTFSESAEIKGTIIELLHSSLLVVQGKVEKVAPPAHDRICVAQIQVTDVIKGEAEKGRLVVAEPLMFPSDVPSYREGKWVTLFLVKLPDYSRWKGYRSKGIHYMAVGSGNGVKESQEKYLGETSSFLKKYKKLATFKKEEEKRHYFEFLLEGLLSPLELIYEASVTAMDRIDNISLLIKPNDIGRLKRFIKNRDRSNRARGKLMVLFSALEGFDGIIEETLKEDPELGAYAVRSLKSIGNRDTIDPKIFEICLKDTDQTVRLETLDLMSQTVYPKAEMLVEELALNDPSDEVRARAIATVGRMGGERIEEVAIQGLKDSSPLVVYGAADEVRKLETKHAVQALGELLKQDDPKNRFIGIIMLGTMKGEDALRVLKEASTDMHLDSKTRNLSRRVLERGPLDINSVQHILGINSVQN